MRRVLIVLVVLAVAREARADEPSSPTKGATPVPDAAAAPAGEAEAPAKPAESNGVFLHVGSKETVTVEREDTGEVVCTSPCNKNVPADGRYRIGGSHRTSSTFMLAPQNGGRADVHVNPGSKAGFWTGVGGLALGTLLIGGGVTALIVGMNNGNDVPGPDSEVTDTSYTDAMILGTALIIGGVFVGLGGGAYMASNASSSVWGNVQKSAGSTRDALPRAQPNVRAGLSGANLPRPMYLSIFSGTF